MLHIVQVVLHGCAEAPKVYGDEGAARAAFVDCARKYWAQSYAAFCERSGVDGGLFSSAQAFVATFDLADRSRIHYWSVAPEDATADDARGLQALKGQGERIERLVGDLDQASAAVREGLTGLLAIIADLAGDGSGAAVPTAESDAPGRLAAAAPFTPSPAAQPAADTYNTREWKEYVETIKNMCGGNRSEYHLFTRHDWRQAVYGGQTSLEYWDWVAATIDHYIETAQQAGYAVVEDQDKPGRYRFRTPDGSVSDISTDAQGEAWCRAGLHLEGSGRVG